MPGVTPVLGLPYPYETEPINPADFGALANAIDAAQTTTTALAQFQLTGRPVLKLRTASGLTSASGAGLTVTFNTSAALITDNTGMFNTGVPDRVIPTVSGMYLISYSFVVINSGTTTIDEVEILFIINGNYQTGERGPGYGPNVFSPTLSCTTMLPMTAGDTFVVQVSWAGTGGPANWSGQSFLGMSYVGPFS